MIGHAATSVSGAHFAFTDRWGGVSAVPYEELNLGGAVGDDPDAVRANRELRRQVPRAWTRPGSSG